MKEEVGMEGGTAFCVLAVTTLAAQSRNCPSKSWPPKSNAGVRCHSFGDKLSWGVSSLVRLLLPPSSDNREVSRSFLSFSCLAVQKKALAANSCLTVLCQFVFSEKKFRIFLIALMPALKSFKRCCLGSSTASVLKLSAM